MTENGYYESDVCIICGAKCYVSKRSHHAAILEHVIEKHMERVKAEWSNEHSKCWCGFKAIGHDQHSQIRRHLSLFVDMPMAFPSSVDKLWAHYHAAILNVNPKEEPCGISTGTQTK